MTVDLERAGKLFSNRLWRLENLYYIIDKQGQRVKFKLNYTQKQLLASMHNFSVVLKARQLGISTLVGIAFLDIALFNSNVSCGIISYTNEEASAFFRKLKYAFDNLPEELKAARATISDSSRELQFNNNSSIRCATSLRGSTLNYLLVSEYGKISATDEQKSREIRTGSLNTLPTGAYCVIESTAEGRKGDFYEILKQAQAMQDAKKKLGPLDWRFHFFPWHKNPEYVLPSSDTFLSPELQEYFKGLEDDHKIVLSLEQKNWYAKKAEVQRDDMLREYPSVPEEAFFASSEGSYYGRQLVKARQENRIRKVYYDENHPVFCAMDIGYSDATAVWWYQVINQEVRFLDYYERSGEPLPHYLKIIKEKPYATSQFFGPHDLGNTEYSSGLSRVEVARNHDISFTVLPRLDLIDGINACRTTLSRCIFDEEKCSQGLKALEAYTKSWNNNGHWNDKPLHNHASNGADGFRYAIQSLSHLKTSGINLEEYRKMKEKRGMTYSQQNQNQIYNSILGN
jgi:hypothetical protein